MAADVFMGYDKNCVAWITATRVLESEAIGGRASRRRREKRRSRRGELD